MDSVTEEKKKLFFDKIKAIGENRLLEAVAGVNGVDRVVSEGVAACVASVLEENRAKFEACEYISIIIASNEKLKLRCMRIVLGYVISDRENISGLDKKSSDDNGRYFRKIRDDILKQGKGLKGLSAGQNDSSAVDAPTVIAAWEVIRKELGVKLIDENEINSNGLYKISVAMCNAISLTTQGIPKEMQRSMRNGPSR